MRLRRGALPRGRRAAPRRHLPLPGLPQAHGSAFNAFAIFETSRVELHGSPGYNRRYCPACGSRVCGTGEGDEVELALGSFDVPGRYTPEYESWVGRREHWLAPLPVRQNPGNLPDA